MWRVVVAVLVVARVCAALWAPISDCDETFNYWEPVHKLVYNYGFQVWEYAPQYALRSYLFVGIYAAVARLIDGFVSLAVLSTPSWAALLLPHRKLLVFYGLRLVIALATCACEIRLLSALRRGLRVPAAVFMALSPGMFACAAALLPQTFCLQVLCLSASALARGETWWCVWWGSVAVLLGWPFCALCLVPAALVLLCTSWRRTILSGVCAVAVVVGASVAVDMHFYGRPLIAVWNIFRYNALQSGGNLYGVEPLSFYLKNLGLNFNMALGFVLLAIPLVFLSWRKHRSAEVVCGMPMLLWLCAMFPQAHKEERFLFVVYPYMCVCAAIGCVWLWQRVRAVVVLAMALTVALSLSRTVALSQFYGAPLNVLRALPTHAPHGDANVCFGREWYRFPSHFHLNTHEQAGHDSGGYRVAFVRSGFDGQLPLYFPSSTETVQPGFNAVNAGSDDRFVELGECDFVVDWVHKRSINGNSGSGGVSEDIDPHSVTSDAKPPQELQWNVLAQHTFLHAESTPAPHRWLFWPAQTEAVYTPYYIAQQISASTAGTE